MVSINLGVWGSARAPANHFCIPKTMWTIVIDQDYVKFHGAVMGEISTIDYNGQVAERNLNATWLYQSTLHQLCAPRACAHQMHQPTPIRSWALVTRFVLPKLIMVIANSWYFNDNDLFFFMWAFKIPVMPIRPVAGFVQLSATSAVRELCALPPRKNIRISKSDSMTLIETSSSTILGKPETPCQLVPLQSLPEVNGNSSILKWRYWPYFVGIFPYIGLLYALYMLGTSNLGSWNGHWWGDTWIIKGFFLEHVGHTQQHKTAVYFVLPSGTSKQWHIDHQFLF